MKKITKGILFFCIITLCGIQAHAKKRLIDYAYNVYSQFGEDGIVQKIFEIIGTQSKIAVEFGAWDGIYLSNTANLWTNDLSWQAILIEGDEKRFAQLNKTAALFNIVPICAWVGIHKESCLEFLLQNNGITTAIDLLSIDIDGNDYHIFESLQEICPRVIICEYNPTIPVTYDLYAPYGSKNNFGTSVGALNRIAQKKGYCLVALTVTNAFYVLEKDFEKFSEFETDIRLLNVNDGHMTLVTTYDGQYALVGNKKRVYFYGITNQFEGSLLGDYMRIDNAPMMLAQSMPSYQSH